MLAILIGFSSWRLFHLWRYDEICEWARKLVWTRFPPPNTELFFDPLSKFKANRIEVDDEKVWSVDSPGTWIGRLTSCGWCFSFYISLLATVVSWFCWVSFAPFYGWVLVFLTAWAISCVLYDKVS